MLIIIKTKYDVAMETLCVATVLSLKPCIRGTVLLKPQVFHIFGSIIKVTIEDKINCMNLRKRYNGCNSVIQKIMQRSKNLLSLVCVHYFFLMSDDVTLSKSP